MPDLIRKRLKKQALPSLLNSRQGWARLFALKRAPEPHLHQIEPTNACPYTCVMCPRHRKMTRSVGFMDMDLFARVIDEIAGYSALTREKEIELFHFGESLLHHRLPEMTAYVSQAGLKGVLSVNGPEFVPAKAEQLFRAGAHKIIISLDGYDGDSYQRIRGPHADFDLAVHNIRTAVDIADRLKARTRLVVRMIRLAENAGHAERFKATWKERGIDVELREFFPWSEPEMVELGGYETYPPHMVCPFCWQYLVVQWNGDVVACCRDYNGVNIMGNVRCDSLKDIWNGPAYEMFRHRMTAGDYDNQICPPCMSIYYNEG
ncbi:MAG: SPASM domain-containing protein [Desulfobacterales bacterium]|nr:SPASM domain-containing protein [Desulfobacterales bacterium]